MVHPAAGRGLDDFFPAWRGIATGQCHAQHKWGDVAAQVSARDPDPGKPTLAPKRDLALGRPDLERAQALRQLLEGTVNQESIVVTCKELIDLG